MKRIAVGLLLACLCLGGCMDTPPSRQVPTEPGPGSGGPYGGDGTVDLVVAYFSFTLDGDGEWVSGHMGGHCGFDDWSLDPTTALVNVGGAETPRHVVMREIHPEQSTDRVAHFGTAPEAYWRPGYEDLPRAVGFSEERHAPIVFDDVPTYRGLEIPDDAWLLVDTSYDIEDDGHTWQVVETLHLRHFPDTPVTWDREEKACD